MQDRTASGEVVFAPDPPQLHQAASYTSPRIGDPITIDARGHHCPVPTLRLRKALEQAAPGAAVALLSDDPLACVDVPLFVRSQGHLMLSQSATAAAAGRSAAVLFLVRKSVEARADLAGDRAAVPSSGGP